MVEKKEKTESSCSSNLASLMSKVDEQDAINRYTWYNLPGDLTGRMIEEMLHNKGQVNMTEIVIKSLVDDAKKTNKFDRLEELRKLLQADYTIAKEAYERAVIEGRDAAKNYFWGVMQTLEHVFSYVKILRK